MSPIYFFLEALSQKLWYTTHPHKTSHNLAFQSIKIIRLLHQFLNGNELKSVIQGFWKQIYCSRCIAFHQVFHHFNFCGLPTKCSLSKASKFSLVLWCIRVIFRPLTITQWKACWTKRTCLKWRKLGKDQVSLTPEHPIFRRASQLLHTMAWRWMNSHSDPQPPPTMPPTPPSHNPNSLLPRRYVVDVFIQGGLNFLTIPYPPPHLPKEIILA